MHHEQWIVLKRGGWDELFLVCRIKFRQRPSPTPPLPPPSSLWWSSWAGHLHCCRQQCHIWRFKFNGAIQYQVNMHCYFSIIIIIFSTTKMCKKLKINATNSILNQILLETHLAGKGYVSQVQGSWVAQKGTKPFACKNRAAVNCYAVSWRSLFPSFVKHTVQLWRAFQKWKKQNSEFPNNPCSMLLGVWNNTTLLQHE